MIIYQCDKCGASLKHHAVVVRLPVTCTEVELCSACAMPVLKYLEDLKLVPMADIDKIFTAA